MNQVIQINIFIKIRNHRSQQLNYYRLGSIASFQVLLASFYVTENAFHESPITFWVFGWQSRRDYIVTHIQVYKYR
jgi:hypothetical protein